MKFSLDSTVGELLGDIEKRGATVSIGRVTDSSSMVVTVFTVTSEAVANALIKALKIVEKMDRQSEQPQQTH